MAGEKVPAPQEVKRKTSRDELPSNYDQLALYPRWKARREAKNRLFDILVTAQEEYEQNPTPENLQKVEDAKKKYIDFVFYTQGADKAIKERYPKNLLTKISERIKKKRHQKAGKALNWSTASVGAAGAALLALTAEAIKTKVGSLGIGLAVAGAVDFVLHRTLSSIRKYRKTEKEARERGEGLDEFLHKNSDSYRRYRRGKFVARALSVAAGATVSFVLGEWVPVVGATTLDIFQNPSKYLDIVKNIFGSSA